MSKLSIEDIIETMVNHNIYIKRIDSLLSFNGKDLIIYREMSKFNNLDDYEIPIYKNKKTTAKWSILSPTDLTLEIKYNEGKGGFIIQFDEKDPDSISLIMKSKKPSVMKTVYLHKDNFKVDSSDYDSKIENPFDILNKPKIQKIKFSELDIVAKYLLGFYYFLSFSIFSLFLKIIPIVSSMSNSAIIFISLVFLIFIHIKSKDMFIFFINKHLDKIKKILYN